MQKNLLITVSDSISYLHGVRFVSSFFRNKSAVKATLFYVGPPADTPERDMIRPATEKKPMEAGEKRAQEALETAHKMLLDKGFPAGNVTTRFIFKQLGTAKDIMREARRGAYDAVVLGRRGYMLFFSTSITKEILDRDMELPVWVCRHPDESRRNVLLCVDGSDASLRMVDHVGFMLKDESEHSITLFHVDTGEGQSKEAIMSEARKRLLDNWLSNGRVESTVTAAPVTGVAKAILDAAEKSAYAVVGVGRVGVHKGRLKEWLVGSRTMKLVEEIDKAALWVGR